MIVTIMQPAYLPWLGFFNRMALADVTVILDHVRIDQSSKTKFANRNRIRGAQGPVWLTVPIATTGPDAPLELDRIRIAPQPWAARHWRSIAHSYAKAAHLREHADRLEALYGGAYEKLGEVNDAFLAFMIEALALGGKRILRSSELDLASSKSDLIVEICERLGASAYVSGPFGRDYLDRDAFTSRKIELCFHDYAHPEYPQCGAGFVSHLSALDLLLNCGPDSADIVARRQPLATA